MEANDNAQAVEMAVLNDPKGSPHASKPTHCAPHHHGPELAENEHDVEDDDSLQIDEESRGAVESLHDNVKEIHLKPQYTPLPSSIWLSRQCWTLSLAGILVFMLVVAISTPWYRIAATDLRVDVNTTVDYIIVFYWKGYEISKHSSGKSWETEWNDYSHLLSTYPRDVYSNCNTTCVIALFFALLFFALVLMGLTLRRTQSFIRGIFCDRVKWWAMAIALLCSVLTSASWISYLAVWPKALNKAEICPNVLEQGEGSLWCESIVGSDADSKGGEFWWYPYCGWTCCFVSTFLALGCALLAALDKTPPYTIHRVEVLGQDDDSEERL